MEKTQLFTVINNQYTCIDLPTLSNNFKKPNGKIKSINLSPVLEIAKYNKKLIKTENKKEIILNSKKIISENINVISKKSTYYDKIDMLTYIPQKKKIL